MSKIMDEMIQERVERGELIKGNRPGSVRVVSERKRGLTMEAIEAMEPLKRPASDPVAQ